MDIALIQMERGWPTHCISLLNPGTEPPLKLRDHLVLEFFDIDSADEAKCPTDTHLRELLQFSSSLGGGNKLLIHCHAGIGRSPAAAIAILVQHGMAPADAIRTVHAARPRMQPNRLMTTLADHALGLQGALLAAVDAFLINAD